MSHGDDVSQWDSPPTISRKLCSGTLGMLQPVTSLNTILLHPLVLEFCVFVSNSFIACKREERGERLGALQGPSRGHFFLLVSLASYSVFSENAAQGLLLVKLVG